MKRFGGLRRRWLKNTLCVVVPLAAVCVAVAAAAFSLFHYAGMRSDLSYRAWTTLDIIAGFDDSEYEDWYRSCVECVRDFEDQNGAELQFIDADGTLLADSSGLEAEVSHNAEDVAEALTTRMETVFLGHDEGADGRIMALSVPLTDPEGEVIGVLRFITLTRSADRQILLSTLAVLGGCVVFILVVLLFSNYYIRSILSPLEEITAKAKRIAGGTYGVRIETKYDDEIGELARTVNDLSGQISQNEKAQTEFISSLSHELRTPLTAITGWSETILSQEQLDFEETRRGMFIIHREAHRLTEMVLELLDFTRIQDGRMTLNVEPTDIRGEFEDTVFMYGSRLKQEGIQINYRETDEDIPEISCDPKRMRQVFLNILDNAAKHGGEGGRIDASIHCTALAVVIHIRDYGPGIPEDEIPLVKKKFYKGSSKARGSGIGLAVCDEIVQMHGGLLSLSNAEGGGTLVSICIPIKQ